MPSNKSQAIQDSANIERIAEAAERIAASLEALVEAIDQDLKAVHFADRTGGGYF